MVNFANPLLLLLLISVVVFALLYWQMRFSRRRKLAAFGKAGLLESLMPDVSKYLPTVKIIVALCAIISMVIMLARPRTRGTTSDDDEAAGIEVMVAVDVSNSMLASSTDNRDGMSRLNRAKYILRALLNRLDNDHVGLIVFAGEAFTQLPLTADRVSAKMYINDIATGLIDNQGTDLGRAIQLGMSSFSNREDVERALIVITDAEDQEGDAVQAARAAKEEGIQVDVIGLGSTKGAQIPVGNNTFLKDEEGHVVTTYFNEELAREIAEAGGGIYVNGASSSAISDLTAQLGELKTANLGKINYTSNSERFPVFAWIALILVMTDCIISNRKIGFLRKYNFFSRTTKIVVLLLSAGGLSASAQRIMPVYGPLDDTSTRNERRLIREGNEAFGKGDYGTAEIAYLRALEDNPESEAAKYNLALTLYSLQPEAQPGADAPDAGNAASAKPSPRQKAVETFTDLIANGKNPQIIEYSSYNLGNEAFDRNDLNASLNFYKQALRMNPSNEEARKNMRYVQKLLEQQQNQDQQQNQQQDQQQGQQDQDQQDQDQQDQDQQDQQQNQQQQQQSMSEQNREQILNAVEAKDSQARKKIDEYNRKINHSGKRHNTKNW